MANISSKVASEIRFIPAIVYCQGGDRLDSSNYYTIFDEGASRYDNFL